MNLSTYVKDLEKLKSHFTKAPDRVYSNQKLEKMEIIKKRNRIMA